MKDSNNNNQTNDEASASDATDTHKNKFKPSSTNRTSDIYERFLNRVQSIDSDNADSVDGDNEIAHSPESIDRFKKPSAYEPLDEEELRYFKNHEDTIDSEEDTTSIDIDFNNDIDDKNKKNNKKKKAASVGAYVLNKKNKNIALSADTDTEDDYNDDADHASPDIHADLATEPLAAAITKDTNTQKTKSTSGSKLLIIGIIFSLLLSAAIIVLLNKTGFLTTSADRSNADSSKTTSSSTPTVDTEQPAVIDINEAPALNTETPVPAKPQADQNLAAKDDNAATSPQEVPVGQQPTDSSTNNLETDSAITVEEFKEEAQSTLYRETTD